VSAALPRQTRAGLYRLCADLLTHEVDGPRLEGLRELADVLSPAEPALGEWLARADEPALAALRAEFARLFLLPKGVSPRACAWLDAEGGRAADALAALAHRAMEALDLHQTRDRGALAGDHLGLLYAVTAAALASDVPERVRVGEHLEAQAFDCWVPVFADALVRSSREPLYRALGRTVAGLHPPGARLSPDPPRRSPRA
jgi:TorA maturation chaperone TorD